MAGHRLRARAFAGRRGRGVGALPLFSVLTLAARLAEGLSAVQYVAPHLDHVPGELRPLVEPCMDKDPANRPTAKQFLADLVAGPALAGGSPWKRWISQRPRIWITGAVAAAVGLIAGIGVLALPSGTALTDTGEVAAATSSSSTGRLPFKRRRLP